MTRLGHVAVGLLLIGFGLANAIWPYRIARFGERVDAIGSKRAWSEVEPTEWNVSLTRSMGLIFVAFGVVLILTSWLW